MANSTNSDTTGLVAYDGTSTFNGRTITAGTSVQVTNGDGLSGNPTISADADIPLTYTTDSGTATPAANVLTVSGGTGINTSGSGDTLTTAVDTSVVTTSYSADSGTATPSAGIINLVGAGDGSTSAASNTVTINSSGGGGSGAFVFISSQTASASANIAFTGLTTTYFAYKIVYDNVAPATDGVYLRLRTSTDGGSSYNSGSTDYRYGIVNVEEDFTPSGSRSNTSGNNYIRLHTPTCGNASNEAVSGEITLYNPRDTAYTRVTFVSELVATDGVGQQNFGAGYRQSAQDVNAIQFSFTSGNIASGKFTLYGISAS